MDNAAWIGLQWVIVLFLGLIGLNIVIKIWSDKINLNSLLSEPDGKASLSRFQLLLFTFVIVGIYVVLCLQQGDLIEISNGVLGLLGISGGFVCHFEGHPDTGGQDASWGAEKFGKRRSGRRRITSAASRWS